jgi:hypothetical protein
VRMSKWVIVGILCIAFGDSVLCLTCYSTDIASLRRGVPQNFEHDLQDCYDYIYSIRDALKFPKSKIPPDMPMRCFSVFNEADDSHSIVIKGCWPPKGCTVLKRIFETIFPKNETVKCVECEGEACNSRSSTNTVSIVGFLFVVIFLRF